jgi:nucleoid-associated protein YgaU
VAAETKTVVPVVPGSDSVGGGGESPLVVTRLTDPSFGPRLSGEGPRVGAPVPAGTGKTEPRPAVTPPVAEKLPAADGFPKDHVIQKNDSPWALAQRYYGKATVSLVSHLEKANPSVNPKALIPGKTYKIPAPPPVVPRAKPAAAVGPGSGNTGNAETATARGQATLTNVSSSESSARPRPATETAKKASEPKEAKTSVAPAAAKETAKAAIPAGLGSDRTYVVKKGETLSSIAKKFYGDSKLFYLIEDGNPDKKLKYVLLMEGDKIWIPPAR